MEMGLKFRCFQESSDGREEVRSCDGDFNRLWGEGRHGK